VLNIVFVGVFAVLYWTYRNRDRLGGGQSTARDPMCGMQVETAHAPATLVHDGRVVYFCSDSCADRFAAAQGAEPAPMAGRTPGHGDARHRS
jgi:YHS domain-containing protein